MKKNLMATLSNVSIEDLDEEFQLTEYLNKQNEKKSVSKRSPKSDKQYTRKMGGTETVL